MKWCELLLFSSIASLVGIPLTILLVIGVGYHNWSPYWAAPLNLFLPLGVAIVVVKIVKRFWGDRD